MVDFFKNISLVTIERVAVIGASFSVVIAMLDFKHRKKQDKIHALADQVSFFREKILHKSEEFMLKIRKIKGEDYEFLRVGLDESSVEFTKENFPEQVQGQVDLLQGQNTFNEQTSILNMLEELSIRIIYSNMAKHSALKSIQHPFVELVEYNAVALLTHKDLSFSTGFPAILQLYSLWKDKVDRRSMQEKLNAVLLR